MAISIWPLFSAVPGLARLPVSSPFRMAVSRRQTSRSSISSPDPSWLEIRIFPATLCSSDWGKSPPPQVTRARNADSGLQRPVFHHSQYAGALDAAPHIVCNCRINSGPAEKAHRWRRAANASVKNRIPAAESAPRAPFTLETAVPVPLSRDPTAPQASPSG